MKKATAHIMLAVVILLIALAGCGKSAETPESGFSTSVSWSDKRYQSAEEMISESEVAIIGEVIDSYTEVRNNKMVFTRQVVKVITVNKGELTEGDSIEVLQTGGTDGGIQTASLSEVPFMERGKEYALCLRFSQPSEKYGQYYLISGGYQGIAEIVPSGEEKDIAFADYFIDAFENSLSAETPTSTLTPTPTPDTGPAYTATSGGVSVPLTPIEQRETAADIPAETLNWLPIAFDEFGQPFEIMQEGEAVRCNFLIHDAETGEELAVEYSYSSGLTPQTVVFQNAVPGRRYLITAGPIKEFGNYAFGAIYDGQATNATMREHAAVPTFHSVDGTELYLNMQLDELNSLLGTMLKYDQVYVLPQHALGMAAVLNTEASGMSWPVVELGFSEGWMPSEGPGIGATTTEVRAYWGEPDVAAEPVNERTPTVNYLLYEFPAGVIEFTHKGDGVITQINLYAGTETLNDAVAPGYVTYLHGQENLHFDDFSCFGELVLQCHSESQGPYRVTVTAADGTETVLAEGEGAYYETIPAPQIEKGALDVELDGGTGDWYLEIHWFPQNE